MSPPPPHSHHPFCFSNGFDCTIQTYALCTLPHVCSSFFNCCCHPLCTTILFTSTLSNSHVSSSIICSGTDVVICADDFDSRVPCGAQFFANGLILAAASHVFCSLGISWKLFCCNPSRIRQRKFLFRSKHMMCFGNTSCCSDCSKLRFSGTLSPPVNEGFSTTISVLHFLYAYITLSNTQLLLRMCFISWPSSAPCFICGLSEPGLFNEAIIATWLLQETDGTHLLDLVPLVTGASFVRRIYFECCCCPI